MLDPHPTTAPPLEPDVEPVRTPEAFDELVGRSDGLVVLFTEGSCRVGEAVEPKLRARLEAEFPRLRLVVLLREQAPELAARLGVLAVPTVIAYFGGKETHRFVRAFSLEELAAAMSRPYHILFDENPA
jgi:thioredoxin-like negative regulator of GroEL